MASEINEKETELSRAMQKIGESLYKKGEGTGEGK